MTIEHERLKNSAWKKWGPYVSDRQWGTVREDYSENGDAWNYTTHDMARSKAWRWGEEGIGGICDDEQLLCFALAFWNKKDPIIKERYFGLSNQEGNHGEDVKEQYYYQDNTPAHSYMKMLYKYPRQAFPYKNLLEENRRRTKQDAEYELIDTGVFNDNNYFDISLEYAKESADNIFIKISVINRSKEESTINILPTVWFRNTWVWGYDDYKPMLSAGSHGFIEIFHRDLGQYWLVGEGKPEKLFCENETNLKRLYNADTQIPYCKDGINDYIVSGAKTINPDNKGTRAALNYNLVIPPGEQTVIRLCLTKDAACDLKNFEEIFAVRKNEADEFYKEVLVKENNADLCAIKRQALAGILWNKQFYYYDVHQWLKGDPAMPRPPAERMQLRNKTWKHANCKEILSVPDKWEFPWFAAWDTAFHCYPMAMLDMGFAKTQLLNLTKEWYMRPDGQLPAYEWNFSDSNPPIHAMVTWEIYNKEKQLNHGKGDVEFLTKVFHKLMINFTWWVNTKDQKGNNIFEGGFLGLDNIGLFDRTEKLSGGGHIEQTDGTSWMAMYALNLLQIAHELSHYDQSYSDISSKFFEHFLYIAGAINGLNEVSGNLWDDEDNFYYDRLRLSNDNSFPLKVRSLVGLMPLLVVETIPEGDMDQDESLMKRMTWFKNNRPDLADLVSHWEKTGVNGMHLISLMRGFRMKTTLKYLLDENEFLSPHGIRSVSKFHQAHPFSISCDGKENRVNYVPAESDNNMYGGNSNWRGPVWIPMNYLVIQGLRRFHQYYGNAFKVECPTGSGNYLNLQEVADELNNRLNKIFLRNENGVRPVYGDAELLQNDEHFKDHILFFEYFDGDTGKGLGASHQTGWTALIATYFEA